jgi:PAS domain S-box-containing protein
MKTRKITEEDLMAQNPSYNELDKKIKELEKNGFDYQEVQEVLKDSEERYRMLADFTYDWETWRGTDGRYIYVSPSCERVTGYTKDEFINDPWLIEKIAHPEDKEMIFKHFREDFGEIEVGHVDFRIITRKGEERWISHYCQPVYGSDKSWLGRRCSNRDITKRKQMEEALKKSSEKIKLFAYSVSHDLKSPAISLYGLTKRLHKNYAEILDEKGRHYCDQILKISKQLALLVEQINVYISTKEAPLTVERISPKEILQMVREEFDAQLNIRQVKWSEPEYIPDINVDRFCMLRMIRNLVDNAFKYAGDGISEIKIGYTDSDQFHVFSVADDGVGLKEHDPEKVFRLFTRRETSRGIEGSGLGLGIVREIAERHQGKVWVEPGLKKGITFYFSISKSLELSG